MQTMGEGWLALELSNSAFLVGLVARRVVVSDSACSRCTAASSPTATTSCKLVRIAQSLLLVQASLLWWFTATHRLTIGWLITLALMNGLIGAFEIRRGRASSSSSSAARISSTPSR